MSFDQRHCGRETRWREWERKAGGSRKRKTGGRRKRKGFPLQSPLSPAPPAFPPLPDACSSSSLSCSSSSRFLFNAGFNAARSFDNSGKKHFCFLPEHSLHATPAGVQPRGIPRATASFHLLIRAGSTQQRDFCPAHPPHRAARSLSSSSAALTFPFPFLGEAPSSTSMASSGW